MSAAGIRWQPPDAAPVPRRQSHRVVVESCRDYNARGSSFVGDRSIMILKPFALPLPADLITWEARRVHLRSTLYHLLGDLPPLFTPDPDIIETEIGSRYRLEKFTFRNGLGDTVYGYTLVPDQPKIGRAHV